MGNDIHLQSLMCESTSLIVIKWLGIETEMGLVNCTLGRSHKIYQNVTLLLGLIILIILCPQGFKRRPHMQLW